MSGTRHDAARAAAEALLGTELGELYSGALLARAIADAVEAALAWQPEPTDPIARGRWGCGCDSAACKLRSDVYRDASTSPHAIFRYTCLTHALTGDGDDPREAMRVLDAAHREQCR